MSEEKPRKRAAGENGSSESENSSLNHETQKRNNTAQQQRGVDVAGVLKIVFLLSSFGIVFCLVFMPDFLSEIAKTYMPHPQRKSSKPQSMENNIPPANSVKIFTKEELAQFTGDDANKPVLLAYLGKVYDVSAGRRHYGPGGGYSFFSGKDATRSFLTGDFKNDLTDNLDGIDNSLYSQIENWEETYSKSKDYKQVGVLCGEFYQCAGDPSPGQPTEKLQHVAKMIEKAKADEAKANEIYKEFPQCNSEWSQANGGRVWCSPKSGGIERKWTGMPRLMVMHKPGGTSSTRCACVHPKQLNDPRLKEYPGCHPQAESCKMPDDTQSK